MKKGRVELRFGGMARHEPVESLIKICQASAFDGRIVTSSGEWDDAFFSSVGIDDETLEFRRNDFIFFREEENCGRANGAGDCPTTSISI